MAAAESGSGAVPAMMTPMTAVPIWSFQFNSMPAFTTGMTIAVITKTARMSADAAIEIPAVHIRTAQPTTRSRGACVVIAGTRGCSMTRIHGHPASHQLIHDPVGVATSAP